MANLDTENNNNAVEDQPKEEKTHVQLKVSNPKVGIEVLAGFKWVLIQSLPRCRSLGQDSPTCSSA